MRSLAALALAPVLVLAAFAAPALAAHDLVYAEIVEEVVEIEETLAEPEQAGAADPGGSERFVGAPSQPAVAAIAAYGPFRVLDPTRAALVGVTDGATPAAFAAMLRDHPAIATLAMVDCPGTEDDRANLRLGALIRERGLATHVPAGGFVASGAVELFLAGVRRSAAADAEFAVHSWADEDGREAADYAPDAPENRAYLDYYRRMGMSPAQAVAFYAMTNSVPFAQARRLTTAELARWVALDPADPFIAPRAEVALAPGPWRMAGAAALDSPPRLN